MPPLLMLMLIMIPLTFDGSFIYLGPTSSQGDQSGTVNPVLRHPIRGKIRTAGSKSTKTKGMERNGKIKCILCFVRYPPQHHPSCESSDASAYKVDSVLFLEMQGFKGRMPLPARASSFFCWLLPSLTPAGSNPRMGAIGCFDCFLFFLCVCPRTAAPEQRQFPFPLPERTRSTHVFCFSFVRQFDRESKQRKTQIRSEYCAGCQQHLPGKQRIRKIQLDLKLL